MYVHAIHFRSGTHQSSYHSNGKAGNSGESHYSNNSHWVQKSIALSSQRRLNHA
ncbi:hypothetical protein RMSM_06179 [Rhodopirellula maiorica SM1]|uniref:Uncharacterized protein n=1 Tax=Rhodopirellula maiorica SM1 TaxID=1265738 RepID=M5RSG3_9BACT|nr:hypothetical protein RMSM_06179 [Rhodopirellula maiorica SM1]